MLSLPNIVVGLLLVSSCRYALGLSCARAGPEFSERDSLEVDFTHYAQVSLRSMILE